MKSRSSKVKKMRSKKLLIGSLLITFTMLLSIYLLAAGYYSNHFFVNTIINGIDCSNKSVKEAQKLLQKEAERYSLTLEERGDVTEQIKGSDINFQISFGDQLEQLLDNQSSFQWVGGFFGKEKYEFPSMMTYDEDLLLTVLHSLDCLDPTLATEPKNAYISSYDEEAGGYHIVEAIQGTKVKKKKLYEQIKQALLDMKESISLEELDCYVKPTLTSTDNSLKQLLDTMNLYVSTVLTYKFGNTTEVLDGSIINSWLSVNDEYQVVIDEQKVKDFVDYIGKTYNTFGKTRTLKTSYHKTIQVSGGDYGWWLNRAEEKDEIINAILAGQQLQKEPVYYQKASEYGENDIGNTYVEINLTAQHLFFYKDGKLLVESDFVSGNVSKNLGTPTGTYPIVYKEREATLVGEDYETPVKYWMPFNGNIGLHDAPWRKEFGKDIYLKKGSHGCINLPPRVAKKIYENIEKGIAVICYELPGTENYKVDEKLNDKDQKTDKTDPEKMNESANSDGSQE
ncbi:MAG TPA: L,D-transpeptidase family protein [Lachnospiraceae bacterium]|nr:L,D-transpeptidase family protein [Lachnospiraceae bacterium]